MKRIKYLIAAPVLRLLEKAENAFAKLARKADFAYISVWSWTLR